MEVLMWLDRFTLNDVQLTSSLLRDIIDVLTVLPMRVLEYFTGRNTFGYYSTTLVAKSPDRRTMKFGGNPEDVLRRAFALCGGCVIECFEVDMTPWTQTLRDIFADNLQSIAVKKAEFYCSIVMSNALIEMMRGLESVYISEPGDAATDKTMKLCAEGGIASLGIGIGDRVTDDALLDFLFSNASMNGIGEGRLLIMNFTHPTEISLSRNFFEKLVKKCLDQTPKAMPTVALCAVDTTSYDRMAKTHESRYCKCTHFQFEAAGEKFEVVVRKWKDGDASDSSEDEEEDGCHFILRKGHADFENCPPPLYLYEWKEQEFGD
ncbi:hypothetical protein AAVH_38407 [Aphelenchoides avenae]|nr:hypothetical protein AAVH_38407 [Aphelenchus avenae]